MKLPRAVARPARTFDVSGLVGTSITRETTRPHFSYSQLSTYTRCSWKYYLRYILGIPDPKSIESAMGSGVHSVLEINAKRKIKELVDMPLPEIQDLTADTIQNGLQDFSETDKAKGILKDEAISQVTLFRVRDAEKITPLVAEYGFELQVGGDEDYPDTPRPVIGFIDTVEVTTRPASIPGNTSDILGIVDYKRVGRKKGQSEIDITPQLDMYDMAIHERLGYLSDAIGFRQFGVTVRDGPWTEVSYRSPELLDPAVRLTRHLRLKQIIRRVQDAINKGVFIPTDNPLNCSWCPYRQMCQYSQVKTSDRNG